jgi:DNA-binding MarR family transcriptional regulator/GNAT superfamily N-acetyltransferase
MDIMPSEVIPHHVKTVRSFNRFYTQRIGVLDPRVGSEFYLTEVRLLYELAHRDQPTASELANDLRLDVGYLSRILRRFEAKGWLARVPSPADARQNLLKLTDAGHAAFAPLQQRSRDEAAAMLQPLPHADRSKVIAALDTVQRMLDPSAPPPATRTVVLRDLQPGDMGWVVQQHGEIYSREYGWSIAFEGMVADIAAKLIKTFDPEWERAWIAEMDGERVGCVFVVRKARSVAQLRLLILTQQARGLGLGARLTDEALAFARSKGYKKMVLWTNSVLTVARDLYQKRGFKLVKSEPYRGFGQDLIGQMWELVL